MNLQETIDQVAYMLYSKKFDEVKNTEAIDHRQRVLEMAAELYAKSMAAKAWDDACEAQIKNCLKEYMRIDLAISSQKFITIGDEIIPIEIAPKPKNPYK